MRAFIYAVLAAIMAVGYGGVVTAADRSAEIPQELRNIASSLHPQKGKITLSAAKATLNLGDKYDYYDPVDAKKILIELWGNPPGSQEGVLGIVMPAGVSPLADSWGAVITFEDVGYVSDEDAAEVDFDEILSSLKQASDDSNEERRQAGYPVVHLKGWAEIPKYDAQTHSVVWAKDLQFEGSSVDTLNYDLRTLGRSGVLSVNFVSVMPELPGIRVAANDFASHATFNPGARYADFDPSIDKKAEYGIGGLIAAGAGVAAAKKLGLLAILAKFGKLIFVGVAVALAASWRFIARLFGFGDRDEETAYSYIPEETPPPTPEGGEPRTEDGPSDETAH